MYTLSKISTLKLATVCIELKNIVYRAFSYQKIDMIITEGARSIEEQKERILQGRTRALYSKHLKGEAVDIYPYIEREGMIVDATHDSWNILEEVMKKSAQEENVNILWGGDWKNSVDKPHWEITIRRNI